MSKGSSQRAPAPDAFGGRSPTAALLDVVRDFRVEWDDGSTGTAGAMAIFIRTTGFGTGHQKLELLTADDVAAISLEEQRILARTRVPPAAAFGGLFRTALTRAFRRFSQAAANRGRRNQVEDAQRYER